jgi:hypothetical protein
MGAIPVALLFENTAVRRAREIAWQRDDANPEVTASVFDVTRVGRLNAAEPSIHVLPSNAPDFFAVRRGLVGEDTFTGTGHRAWLTPQPQTQTQTQTRTQPQPQPTTQPVAPPGPSDSRRSPDQREAAGCFDRGLAFLNDKKFGLALDEWERALALDPTNRTYQTNLKRLRARR